GGTLILRPYFAVPVFSVGWNASPRPSIEPGPDGSEMVLGVTPLLSAARAGTTQNPHARISENPPPRNSRATPDTDVTMRRSQFPDDGEVWQNSMISLET